MRRTVCPIFGCSSGDFFIRPLLFDGRIESAANGARVGSAALMMLYVVTAAVFYSTLKVEGHDTAIGCMNGHVGEPLPKFCEECVAPVTERPVDRGF